MKTQITSIALSLSLGLSAFGQEAEDVSQALDFSQIKQMFPSAQNEGQGKLGTQATIDIKNDLVFLDGKDADQLLQSWGNLPAVIDGLVMPEDGAWCITFEFSSVGYVKDDEQEDIDAEEILEQNREAQEEANKARVKQGFGSLTIVSWVVEPRYNAQTNNLEWGMLLKDDEGSETINHEIRLLGRRGVTSATLLCSPAQFKDLQPVMNATLDGFSYTDGNKYGEYKEGDKIAEYGLLGLMGAGGAFVLWKFWKPIGLGVLAVGAGVKKFFGGFFGGKSEGRIS